MEGHRKSVLKVKILNSLTVGQCKLAFKMDPLSKTIQKHTEEGHVNLEACYVKNYE